MTKTTLNLNLEIDVIPGPEQNIDQARTEITERIIESLNGPHSSLLLDYGAPRSTWDNIAAAGEDPREHFAQRLAGYEGPYIGSLSVQSSTS